jgi:NAD-dependent DNA ligase
MTMANCPQCGKPLTKEGDKNRYKCENERCPVVYVRSPDNPFRRKVALESSVGQATIRRIEEATAQEISLARSIRLSRV